MWDEYFKLIKQFNIWNYYEYFIFLSELNNDFHKSTISKM